LRFEQGARNHFPGLRAFTTRIGERAGRHYVADVAVPHYESRRVHVLFERDNPNAARVEVDGPTESPHRFGDGSLCIWRPRDPVWARWIVEDGLVRLLGLTIAHLFREAWWRETGEWPGPEAPHAGELRKAVA
jgi:hypothetical protein